MQFSAQEATKLSNRLWDILAKYFVKGVPNWAEKGKLIEEAKSLGLEVGMTEEEAIKFAHLGFAHYLSDYNIEVEERERMTAQGFEVVAEETSGFGMGTRRLIWAKKVS